MSMPIDSFWPFTFANFLNNVVYVDGNLLGNFGACRFSIVFRSICFLNEYLHALFLLKRRNVLWFKSQSLFLLVIAKCALGLISFIFGWRHFTVLLFCINFGRRIWPFLLFIFGFNWAKHEGGILASHFPRRRSGGWFSSRRNARLVRLLFSRNSTFSAPFGGRRRLLQIIFVILSKV